MIQTSNGTISLVDLDFDAQKASLISFLKGQDRFRDYDFTGSDINVLLDILTVNSFKSTFFLNMAISEGFIDSAQRRTSILSGAKELNYVPRSARSAKATITVSFTATGESQPYIIPKGKTFTSQVKSSNYTFSVPETITVASANTSFSFTTDIYEGFYVKDSYIYDPTVTGPVTFKITNPKADTDSLVVSVFEDNAVIGTDFRKVSSLLDLDETSKVYFIQPSSVDGTFEVLFGDGIIGYQPKSGSLIVIDYRLSSGLRPNGCARFNIGFDPTGDLTELTSTPDVVTISNADGGAEIEDIETTRFYAPRWFQTQERAIVPSDYKTLLKTQFPEINAVNVYGGETVTPPQFGKVIVAVQISNVPGLPDSKKQQYYTFLKSRCPIPIVPVFVLPDFTYLDITSTIRYNVNLTNETVSRMKTIVTAAITDYNETFLNDFEVTFRNSKFSAVIDNSDPSVVSNILNVLVYKKTNPVLNVVNQFVVNFAMALENDLPALASTHPINSEKVLSSSGFVYNGKESILEDDNAGNIRCCTVEQNNIVTSSIVGSIDYNTGILTFVNFRLDSYDGDALRIYVRPRDRDITTSQNTIITIEPDQLKLTIEQISE